eukprot:scaffold2608_cov245-Pinguiococcus_pyrenoidosus.AAC.3
MLRDQKGCLADSAEPQKSLARTVQHCTARHGTKQHRDPGFTSSTTMYAAFLLGLLASAAAQQLDDAELVFEDDNVGDQLGFSCGIDGNVAVVGVPGLDTAAGTNAGSVYIWELLDGEWLLTSRVFEPSDGANHQFGWSVAISGNVAIAGARLNSVALNNAGAASLIFLDQNFTQLEITAPTPGAGDLFGTAVDITANYAIVGSPRRDAGVFNAGSAYIYTISGGTTTNVVEIFASSRGFFDEFGQSVAIDGDVAVVGAPLNNDGFLSNTGSVHVFKTTDGGLTWPEQAILDAGSEANINDRFGTNVGISGGVVIAGAPLRDDGGLTSSGAVYFFTSTDGGATWPSTVRVNAPPAEAEAAAQFGYAVDIEGDNAVIGARLEDEQGNDSGIGYLYAFNATSGSWEFTATLIGEDREALDEAGFSVAITDVFAVVGAPRHDHDGLPDSGAAYIYTV